MKTIFSLDNDVLESLDAVAATKAFRNLLWCEARRIGLSTHKIVISLRTNISDGGIDARVDGAVAVDSIIIGGATYFQIKAGQAFKPWQKSSLKNELFGSSRATPTRKNLASGIRECLRSRGRYVIATFGYDLTPERQTASKRALAEFLEACGYKKPKVDVLGQSQLLSLFAFYPSLTLELAGKGDSPFLGISAWRARDDMKPALQLATAQSNIIESIRKALRGNEHQHVRVIGEPGIGKSRLVLEALSTDDLSAAVIYILHAEDFQNSHLFNELIRGGITYSVVLVIDECIEKERVSIWNSLKGKTNLRLVTIDHGPERSRDDGMLVLECPRLPEDKIKAIIASYIPPNTDASHWARWCDGIPRVAHAVGENLKRNPEDLLKSPATVPLWERFVAGYEGLDGKNAQDALAVLRHVALFTRFGFEDPVTNEAQFVATIVQSVDTSMTWARFQEIVERLRGRRILQGKRTLFIVPKALHIYLWVDYWKSYGRGFEFQSFFDKVPPQLRHWFLQFFIYGHVSPVAQTVIDNILSPVGPFSSRGFIESRAGCRFLNYLAEADPPGTLRAIERSIGSLSLEELKQWETGRQDIVWALEKIAVWRENFLPTATLLVRLALTENATNSNNSTGMLVNLFRTGPGWAGTQASPEERFPVIQELLGSEDNAHKVLGLKLCESWLNTYGSFRVIGAEYQGLRPEIKFWWPKHWKEVIDAWRLVWSHLMSVSREWSIEERRMANTTLINFCAGLLHVQNMSNEVMDTMFTLADDPATDKRHLTHMVIGQLTSRTEKIPKSILGKLRALDKKLTGESFRERFCRHVLNTTWDEDHYKKRKGDIRNSPLPSLKVQKLVREVTANTTLFSKYLPEFVVADGHRLFEFGAKLAEAHQSPEMVEVVVSAQLAALPERKFQFIDGYFAGLKSWNSNNWEAASIRLLDNDAGREVGISVILSSGLSKGVLLKLLDLFLDENVPATVFSQIAWQASADGISEELVKEVLSALLDSPTDEDLQVAIELTDHYFFNRQQPKSCDEVLLLRLITSKTFFRRNRNNMASYHWESIVRGFRKRFPARDLELLSVILSHLVDSHSNPCRIANEIARDNPIEAWPIVRKFLEYDEDDVFWVIAWLGQRFEFDEYPTKCAIMYFDSGLVMDWASLNPKRNARILLRCLPKSFDDNEGGKLTLQFIEAYSDDEELSSALMSHFWTGGWTGPESAHLTRKRDRARAWISQLKSGKIRSWLYRYIDFLNKRIIEAEIREEREF